MNVRKTDVFIADVERQFDWYAVNASWQIAEHYLAAIEASCAFVGHYPSLGSRGGLAHWRLREWRFAMVFRPFQKHLLFYEVTLDYVVMRRASHGHRNLPRTLLDPPDLG